MAENDGANRGVKAPPFAPLSMDMTGGTPPITTGLGTDAYNAQGAPLYPSNQLSPMFALQNPGAAAAWAISNLGGTQNLKNPWTQMVMKYAEGLPLLASIYDLQSGGPENAGILPFFQNYVGALRSPLAAGGVPGAGADNPLYSAAEVTDFIKSVMSGTAPEGIQERFASQDWGEMEQTLASFLTTVAPTAINPFKLQAMMNDLQQKALDYQEYIGFGADGVTPSGAWDWLQHTGWLQRWLGV